MKRFLIVVDMQNDFVDGALGSKEAAAIVPKVVKKIRGFDGEIIATLDTHGEDYLDTMEGKKLPVVHCVKWTNGWQLNTEVAKALRDRGYFALEKPTFGSVELPEIIESSAFNEELYVELVGLCTDICVVSNALLLKAFFPGADIHVDASCCAGVTPESHEAALATMKSCHIEID